MPVRGIIFDLDGTLLDTLPDLTDAVNAGLAALHLPPCSAESVRTWIGDGMTMLCHRVLAGRFDVSGETGISAARVAELTAATSAYYDNHRLDKTQPFPGIVELLDELTRRGLPLGVLSNKPHEHTQPIVSALFGRWSFVRVEGCRTDGQKKPNPATALRIISAMRLQPAEVMLVGDSGPDVLTAANAGAISVGATWGYRPREELVSTGALYLIDSPLQLLELL